MKPNKPVPTVAKAHGSYASQVKKAGGDKTAESVQDAARTLCEAKIREFVERTVAAAPELLPEQKSRLSALFAGAK